MELPRYKQKQTGVIFSAVQFFKNVRPHPLNVVEIAEGVGVIASAESKIPANPGAYMMTPVGKMLMESGWWAVYAEDGDCRPFSDEEFKKFFELVKEVAEPIVGLDLAESGGDFTSIAFSGDCGIARIFAERQRQIEKEGWTPEHDDAHSGAEMANAAAVYADAAAAIARGATPFELHEPEEWGSAYDGSHELTWPWDDASLKLSPDPIRNLEKAGALCAAEIDRLLRVKAKAAEGGATP